MRNLILNLFLLILRISFDLSPDANYKGGRFFKALSKKNLEFVLSRRDSTIAFNLSLVLLPAEFDFISEEQGREG